MNRWWYYVLVLIGCMQLSARALQAPYSFGRTHFIIGAPEQLSFKLTQEAVISESRISESRAYFSPDDNIQAVLCEYISTEQQSLDIAIFSFTNKQIADAIIAAYKRGVRITIVIDPSALHDRFGKITSLKDHGISIYVYDVHYKKGKPATLGNYMHNKFIIFGKNTNDRSYVWTGSFNFTKSASVSNQENVVLLDDQTIIAHYQKQFSRLLTRSKRLK